MTSFLRGAPPPEKNPGSAPGNVSFKWNMDNFKFNFLSRGQLESLFKSREVLINFIPRGFSGNLIFAIIARMLCGNHLNPVFLVSPQPNYDTLKVLKRHLLKCTDSIQCPDMWLLRARFLLFCSFLFHRKCSRGNTSSKGQARSFNKITKASPSMLDYN